MSAIAASGRSIEVVGHLHTGDRVFTDRDYEFTSVTSYASQGGTGTYCNSKPRNPRHFDIFEGGETVCQNVSDTFCTYM